MPLDSACPLASVALLLRHREVCTVFPGMYFMLELCDEIIEPLDAFDLVFLHEVPNLPDFLGSNQARAGSFLDTEDGEILIWDRCQDVEYTDVETENRVFSLSILRPFVHRNKVLTGIIVIPRMAEELLEISVGQELKLVFTPERTLKRYPEDNTRWRVWFIESDFGETLLELDDIRLSIYDVGYLIESRQLYDSDTKKLHSIYVILNRVKDFSSRADLSEFPMFDEKLKESKGIKPPRPVDRVVGVKAVDLSSS
ncbi:MAG: hypothetical protein R6V83_10985 [Candidatus Thorarchaeota archaeon]